MKKTLLAGVAAFALVLGASGAAWADNENAAAELEMEGDIEVEVFSEGEVEENEGAIAISVNTLQQTSVNNSKNDADESQDAGMDFGNETFSDQILNVNNFAAGNNQNQQGAISVSVAVGGF